MRFIPIHFHMFYLINFLDKTEAVFYGMDIRGEQKRHFPIQISKIAADMTLGYFFYTFHTGVSHEF